MLIDNKIIGHASKEYAQYLKIFDIVCLKLSIIYKKREEELNEL